MIDQKSILILEDEPEISEMIADRLSREGFKSVQCQRENEAMAKMKNQEFACVIVDIFLKRGNGQNMIEYLDEISRTRTYPIPVLVISGALDVKVVKNIRGKISGAFVKPFDMNALVSKIKAITT